MELPKRKIIRLKGYDYSQKGAYFITICVKDRYELLGTIGVGAIINRPVLSKHGIICENAINEISNHYPMVTVDSYVVMPNHIHMIGRLIIAPTVSAIVQQMKRYVSKQIGFSLWQKSFHDHIIRDEDEYKKIWRYIDENPARWAEDCYYVKD